jgi:hypothetical protein
MQDVATLTEVRSDVTAAATHPPCNAQPVPAPHPLGGVEFEWGWLSAERYPSALAPGVEILSKWG